MTILRTVLKHGFCSSRAYFQNRSITNSTARLCQLRFTTGHEWIRASNGHAKVGISDHAQRELGDIVYVELPSLGTKVEKDDSAASVESVKSVSDVYSPVSGEVTNVNEALSNEPSLVNLKPMESWLFELKMDSPDLPTDLMDQSQYDNFLKDQSS